VTHAIESTTTLTCERLSAAGARVGGCKSKSYTQTAHRTEALGHRCVSGRKVDGCFMEAGATFDGFEWRALISELSHWMRLASGNRVLAAGELRIQGVLGLLRVRRLASAITLGRPVDAEPEGAGGLDA